MSDSVLPPHAVLADRYVVECEIGRGGMATVYQARDLKHDRVVALKLLHPALSGSIGAERFLREIKLTSRLQHPHIVPLHDSGDSEYGLYYVMSYIDGESLRARIARETRLPLADAVRIAAEVFPACQLIPPLSPVDRVGNPPDGRVIAASRRPYAKLLL